MPPNHTSPAHEPSVPTPPVITPPTSRHKPYFRAEIALISLTAAVLILLTSVVTIRLVQEHRNPSEVAAPALDSSDDTLDNPNSTTKPETPSEDNNPDSDDQDTDHIASPSGDFINLQPTVDSWVPSTNRQLGLMIYELDHDRVAASYQPDRIFDIASIYKLFYVYDGYRQIAAGNEFLNDHFTTTTDYRAGRYTLGECLDLAIRESYNGCADPLRSDATRSRRVQKLIDDLNLQHTSNLGLESSASDLTELLKLYYYHEDLPKSLWRRIADSMLNQPPTEVAADTVYDWRQGLPSGFSDQANVYDKVGWNWTGKAWSTYADAAIVEFPAQNRHYTVVILTQDFPNYTPITKLGSLIEAAVLNSANAQ